MEWSGMAGKNNTSKDDYSLVDRMLHRMAFAHPVIQRALGEIESDIFAEKYKNISTSRPVFVTGLPRAGTTILLELLYATGEFATFTYRQMPFILAPIFWSEVTRNFQKKGEMRERAHGDGLEVSFDSPEAFEEIAWLAYLREKYVTDKNLRPLNPADLTSEFREAFPKLIRKLAAAQSSGGNHSRYLSKNNANISRISALRSIFPDGEIFVCFRKPTTHVLSLMAQHQRFMSMHDDDPFARDYMKWIGHYDFGANFRPIDFADRGVNSAGADAANFWLQYWIDAYSFAEKCASEVKFACYEKLLESSSAALEKIGVAANLQNISGFTGLAGRIRNPTTGNKDLDGASPDLLREANELYGRLAALSFG
jgi:hypothetical protein